MKLNSSTSIIGCRVMLVPYKKKHVPKYHKWMQRRDLQEATASEPLTVEEEYEMQQTWFCDDNKCTFIVLDKALMDQKLDEIDAMIGDANLYLNADGNKLTAECGIMIAEDEQRGQGKGFEALTLLLKYACDFLQIEEFVAKINIFNKPSINLFEKIGFKTVEENTVFSEITLSFPVDYHSKTWLDRTTANGYFIANYVDSPE